MMCSEEILRDYPVDFIKVLQNQMIGKVKSARSLVTNLVLIVEVM
jgi:hypothetical protein